MHREELQRLVDMMDALVPRDGAQVQLFQYGGAPDETRMVANERGYLRFGIELIRFGLRSTRAPGVEAKPPDVNELWHEDTEISINWFTRAEPVAKPAPTTSPPSPWTERAMAVALLSFLVGTLVMAVVGSVTTLRYFTG